MDERCRRIFEAAEKTGGLDDTLILIVTDHGGVGHGHGGNDDLEMLNSYIAAGDGLNAGEYKIPNSAPPRWRRWPVPPSERRKARIMTSPFPPTFFA